MDLLTPFYGVKGFATLLGDEGWTIAGQPEAGNELQEYYRLVPWLFRGVDLRANAVAAMPFAIYRGETEVDNSEDYQNKLAFLPNPGALFGCIESALTIWSYCYLERQRNTVMLKSLRYLFPPSVTPKLDELKGLTGWERRLQTRTVQLPPEGLLYFWKPDPFVEIGPPKTSPAIAASAAAGVLLNVDRFAAAFFARGAIKGTVLAVKGSPPEAERKRIKDVWARLFNGIKNAWSEGVFNADQITPMVVGEGLESLANTELGNEKRRDVAGALGIPLSLLFSDAANFATAQQDDMHFYSKTIVPECTFIAGVLNEQLLMPLGYRLAFTPENLDVFQEDENARAASLGQLVSALASPEEFLIAADILGYEIDAETRKRVEAMIAAKAEQREKLAAQVAQKPGQPPAADKPEPEDEPIAAKFNPHHEPAGSPEGGQFAAGDSGGGEGETDDPSRYHPVIKSAYDSLPEGAKNGVAPPTVILERGTEARMQFAAIHIDPQADPARVSNDFDHEYAHYLDYRREMSSTPEFHAAFDEAAGEALKHSEAYKPKGASISHQIEANNRNMMTTALTKGAVYHGGHDPEYLRIGDRAYREAFAIGFSQWTHGRISSLSEYPRLLAYYSKHFSYDRDNKALLADLRRWRDKAAKRGRACEFASDVIPAELSARIAADIAGAVGIDAIKAVFEAAIEEARTLATKGWVTINGNHVLIGDEESQDYGGTVDNPVVMDFEEFATTYFDAGRQDLGDPALARSNSSVSGAAMERQLSGAVEASRTWQQRRDDARTAYNTALSRGTIRLPSRLENLLDSARGDPDNESTQAARRLLAKRGVDWERVKALPAPTQPADDMAPLVAALRDATRALLHDTPDAD